jgi:hypothetical protein
MRAKPGAVLVGKAGLWYTVNRCTKGPGQRRLVRGGSDDALPSQGVVCLIKPGWVQKAMSDEIPSNQVNEDEVERLRQRLGSYDPRQVAIWREMSPVRRLDLVGQMYRFALETVRTAERQRHPDLSPEEFKWRVIRRMHGDLSLGRARESEPDV